MDKTNSFRCVKCALIASNAAIIILGLVGFIIGLVKPNNLQSSSSYGYYGISGSQLALVSCIAVVIATAGLIGALREHFYLLLVYALCILAVFIFRVSWWATAPLHQSERFLMDIGVSVTLLTSLVMLFLFIFAILEALTIKNSLPLTKQKFLQLKSKLKSKTTPSKKKKKTIKLPPKPKGKLSHHDVNNIYTTSGSIYGSSGRRRSPSRTNGHHHSTSSRAKKYHPGNGIEYSSSPDTSHSSNDSNNNHNSTQSPDSHPQTQKHNTSINTKSSHRSSSPLVTGDAVDYQRTPKNYSSTNYYHFQSPTPSSPTPINESNYASKQQLGLNHHQHQVHRPTPPAGHISTRPNQPYTSKTNSLPRTSTTVTSSNSIHNSSTIPRSSAQYSAPVTTTQSGSPMTRAFANFLRPNYQHPSNASPSPSGTLTSSHQSKLNGKPSLLSPSQPASSTPPILPIARPKTLATPVSTTSASTTDYQSHRPIFSTPSTQSTLSSNLFNYSSMSSFGVPKTPTSNSIVNTTASTTPSNLSQTRNLFSTYISPFSANNSRAKSPSPTTATTSASSSSTTSGTLFDRNAIQSSSSLNKWPPPASSQSMPRMSTTPMYYSSSKLSGPVATGVSQSPSSTNYLQLNLPNSGDTEIAGSSARYQSPLFTSSLSSHSVSTSKIPTASIAPALTTPTASSSADIATTSSSTKSSIMARLYPKSYEDYIKSYRYPSEHSTIRPSALSSSSPIVSVQKSDLSPTTNNNNNISSILTIDQGQAEITNTTIMSTTTQHRQLTEHQNQSIYFREIIRES